jgi:hypothetical protein
VTVRDLLEHASGCRRGSSTRRRTPARVRARDRRDAARVHAAAASIYSDLGFILLGFSPPIAAGAARGLFERIHGPLKADPTYDGGGGS